MKPMSPEDARALLDGTTPGPWHECDSPDTNPRDCHSCSDDTIIGPEVLGCDNPGLWMGAGDQSLILAAPELAATIAGMRVEWSRQARITGDPKWHPIRWCRSRDEAERTYWTRSLPSGARVENRLVPRYIIEPETTDG